MRNAAPKLARALMFACLLAAAARGVAAPAVPEDKVTPGPAQLTLDDLRTFTDVFNMVRMNYVDEMGDRALLDSAIAGMVASLDPHSEFLSARQLRLSEETNEGHYGGVGIDVAIRDHKIWVADVIPDTSAQREGVLAGDLILAVNGRPVRGHPIDESFRALHGEPDSQVDIEFQTGDQPPRTLHLTRQYIPVPSVSSELEDGGIGYFRINQFHAHTADDLQQALADVRRQLAGQPLQGVVIDLRDNLGGVIAAAAAVADGFLDSGLVVYTRGRYAPTQYRYEAEPGQWAPGVPVVVLVNGLTASSSEILAAALQENHRATLVGEPTYGKGTVQTLLRLHNGSALKLTTARFFTPTGKPIDQEGVEPDVRVAAQQGDQADTQLAMALHILRGDATASAAKAP